MDPRWIVIVLANALLVFLGGQLNHYLAHWSVSVFLVGACLPLAGLCLRYRPGLIAMFLSGLVVDAARAPVFFGSSAILLATLFTCWHAMRLRLPREGLAPQIVGALLANLVLFLAQPVLLGFAVAAGTTWNRFLVDLLLSELVVALAIPWFFALQGQALLLRGVDLADEARQPGGAL
jgi:rod shape-determining protein MreD